MNDAEQKVSNYKDLFFQEEFGHIDIDEDKEFDSERVMDQYYFFQLFEQINTQTGIPDITRIKKKYHAFTSLTDQQLNMYVEQQKENCQKLVKNVTSLIEQLLITIIEMKQSKFLKFNEMKLMRKLFIHGSRVI